VAVRTVVFGANIEEAQVIILHQETG